MTDLSGVAMRRLPVLVLVSIASLVVALLPQVSNASSQAARLGIQTPPGATAPDPHGRVMDRLYSTLLRATAAKKAKRKVAKQHVVAIEQWTPTSHTVSKTNGKNRQTLFSEPTFKRTSNGWQRLSGRVTRAKSGAVRASRTVLPMSFGTSGTRVMRLTLPRGAVDVSLKGAHLSRPAIKRAGQMTQLTYKGVFRGVDLQYRIEGTSIKEQFLIKNPRARRDFAFAIKDRKHQLGDVARTDDGGYTFSSEVSEGLTMALAAPAAWAADGSARSPAQSAALPSARQSLTRTESGYRLKLAMVDSWAADKEFPVVLDPSILYRPSEGTLAAAFAPISSTACSGDPCELSSQPYGSVYVSSVGTGLGETQAYFQADMSNLSSSLVSYALLTLGYGEAADGDGYPETTLHRMTSVLSSGATGADLAASQDPAVLASDGGTADSEWCEAPGEHPYFPYGCAFFDVTAAVQDWIDLGAGDEVAFAFQVDPLATESTNQPSDSSECISSRRDDHQGCYYSPILWLGYEGDPLPPPIPVAQTYGCDCRWYHGPDVVTHAADPVSTVTGQAMERFVDVAQTAPGIPMAFARTYNGGDDSDGPMGVGWTHDFNSSVTEDPISGDVTFRDPTGGQLIYHPQPGGGYLGDTGATGTLTALGGGGWTMTSLQGEVLTFDADGRLLSDTDRQGRGITLGYTGSGSGAQLSTITDDAGQVATLTYGTSGAADGKITEVETDDGRTVTYDYTTVAGAPHLTSIEDVTGEVTDVEYDSTTGRLNKILDPTAGEHAQNVYDGSGRITEQTDANGQTTTFEWTPFGVPGQPDGTGTMVTTDPLGNETEDFYYGNVLIRHTDAQDATTRYAYDADLNLVAVTDALEQVTTMTYDANGNMLTRTGPAPSEVAESWTYNGDNQVTSHTDGRGKTTTYDYNLDGQLETTTDPLSHETNYTYDVDGNLKTLTTAEGRVSSYDYDVQGNLISQTSPGGHETTFTYDAAGNQTSRTSANGNEPGATPADYTSTFTHDDAGQILTATDPDGTVTTNTYDEAGRVETTVVTDDSSNLIHDLAYTYDDAGNLLTTTDFTRTTVTNTYEERGLLASTTDAEGHTTTYDYDQVGRRIRVFAPRGNEPGADPWDYATDYGYDQLGRQVYNGTSYTTYDENGRPMETGSLTGRLTNYNTYDGAGNLLTTTDAVGRVTTRTYDDASRLSSYARPDEDPTIYSYDNDGLRLSETSPSGDSTWTWTYTDEGQIATQVDARGNAPLADPEDYTTSYDYDAEGRLTSVTDQLGHQTTSSYDALGRTLSASDARGKITSWAYDAAGRVTSVTPPGGADPTTYTYDQYGDRLTRTDALGHETSFTYDQVHQVTSVTDPLDRTETYTYDADGNLISTVVARGNETGADPEDWTISQEWNRYGQLTSRTISNPTEPDQTVTFERYVDGLLEGFTAPVDGYQVTTDLRYNNAGQLTSVRPPDGANFSYTYNDTGDIETRTYPNLETVTYGHNADGLIDSQTSDGLTTTYSYDRDRHLTQTAYPAGTDVVENRSYDRAGRTTEVATLNTTGPTVVDGFAYTRDPNGNPTRITRTRGGSTDEIAFAYDDRDWLITECLGVTSCTGAADYVSYTYDDVGNRLQMDRVGSVPDPGTTDYTYDDADQLTSTDDGTTIDTYTYDADGNLTSGGRVWNADNQMTASNTSAGATTYTYDGLGNRRTIVTASTTTQMYWDINNRLPMLGSTTSTDNATYYNETFYRYTPQGELLQTEHGYEAYPRSFHTHDALGSITDTFQADGTPTAQATYDAWGVDTVMPLISGAVTPNFGYTGGYAEPGTEETHLRARNYSPTTGRFSSTDLMPQNAGNPWVSDYLYVENQPLVHIDPSGLCFGPDQVCAAAEEVKEAAEAAADKVKEAGEAVAEGTTDHFGGCADRDVSECGVLFTDLISLGGIESAVGDADGCADHDLSDCGWLFVDLFTAGVGSSGISKLCKSFKHVDDVPGGPPTGGPRAPAPGGAADSGLPLDWSIVSKAGETRAAHVALHEAEDASKMAHGVFIGDSQALTNEAWSIAQARGITPLTEGGVDIYRVPMGRNVGYGGGANAGEMAEVPHRTIEIITRVGTNELITAYPVPLG